MENETRPIVPAPGNTMFTPGEAAVETVMDKLVESEGPIGQEQIAEAIQRLQRYKAGKSNLELRVVEDEQWYKLRHWEVMRKQKKRDPDSPAPASAWLFNAIANKHADAMDNYPEPVVLAREKEDEQSARTLSAILPVIMERNQFEETYSDNWWEKLKHGTGAYGVFWDKDLEDGLGDISIQSIDLLNLFWQPGVTDIQKSRDVFVVDLVDDDVLKEMYPDKNIRGGNAIDVAEYVYDDAVDTTEKSLVVDWYYKRKQANGKTILHYAKFVGDTLLYSSENDPQYSERGWYDHGMYPIVLDNLFPEKGTPVGWGYVALCKDPQLYIDNLSANILKNAMMASNPRYFVSEGSAINEEEFKDWSNPLVHVNGSLDDNRLRQVEVSGLTGNILNTYQLKVDEMKETASNRDVNSGSSGSGVTAAAAIAALQEAGNKVSRDMIAASYRSMCQIEIMCIELIRQFYDTARAFRIQGPQMLTQEFIQFSAAAIRSQQVGKASDGTYLYRKPIFDLKIKAQKKNPFSQLSQNETAKELFSMGFFNPAAAQPALGCLEMMEFEGKDKVVDYVRQGQTLQNIVQQQAALIQALTGAQIGATQGNVNQQGKQSQRTASDSMAARAQDSQVQAQTPYAQRTVENARASVGEGGSR